MDEFGFEQPHDCYCRQDLVNAERYIQRLEAELKQLKEEKERMFRR